MRSTVVGIDVQAACKIVRATLFRLQIRARVSITDVLEYRVHISWKHRRRSIAMSMSVCLSVRTHNSKTARSNFTNFCTR